MLRFLDEFEGVGEGYYDRIEIPVELVDSGKDQDPEPLDSSGTGSFTASAYFLKEFKQELLNLPFLENYDSYGSHGLPYDERLGRTAKEEADKTVPEVKAANSPTNN